LRCRVNKRASKLFGVHDSEAKALWAEEEFGKRREKRQEKERRKDVVNNVLSQPASQQQHQQQMTANAVADDLAHSFAAYPSVFDASKLLEIPSELQRHLLEQLNLVIRDPGMMITPPTSYSLILDSLGSH
jgi:C-terminal processing protease CtpA/Prc